MPSKIPRGPKTWYRELAHTMVAQGIGIKSAAAELQLNYTSEELDRVLRNDDFKAVLWQERHKHNIEMVRTPGFGKESVMGMLLDAIQKLLEAGEWDKAATAIEKLAKVAGWLGADTNINVLSGLTTKDIEAAKTRLKEQLGLGINPEPASGGAISHPGSA